MAKKCKVREAEVLQYLEGEKISRWCCHRDNKLAEVVVFQKPFRPVSQLTLTRGKGVTEMREGEEQHTYTSILIWIKSALSKITS